MGYIKIAMQTVQIVNVTKGTVLAQQAETARSFGQRLKGLLSRSGLGPEQGLILEHCNCIHTCFMRFPIDVLFLDKNKRIVRIIEHMPPFRLSRLVWSAKTTIELPAGKISQANTQIGDIIDFK